MIRTKNLIHPGEILKEEFLDPMGISQNRLALDLHDALDALGEITGEVSSQEVLNTIFERFCIGK